MEQSFVSAEVRQLDRVIRYLATRRYIKSSVFAIAFLETSVSPILPEIVVAVILSYRKDISWKILALVSALGSAAGGATLYVLGRYIYKAHETWFRFIEASSVASHASAIFSHNTFVSIFLSTFVPLSDRVFAFFSGVFMLSFPATVSAFFLGRLIRVGIAAYFSYRFGSEARAYTLKHTRRATFFIIFLALLYVLLKMRGIL